MAQTAKVQQIRKGNPASLRAMAAAVAAMRSDIDAAMARLSGLRMQIGALALGLDLAAQREKEGQP